jgi:hypothetical protein
MLAKKIILSISICDPTILNICQIKKPIVVKDTKNHKNKGLKKSLNLTFKQGIKQNYAIQKQ